MAKLSFESAAVLSFHPDKVWAEFSDFIEQTEHFGIRDKTTHYNPEEAATNAAGCIRVISSMDPPVKEKLLHHSDAERTFTLTVLEPNALNMKDYKGTLKLCALTDGTTLCHASGTFEGPDFLKNFCSDLYKGAFASIAKKLSEAGMAELKQCGPKAEPSKSGRCARKVAIVTGGAQGLGEACCRALAREGAVVVVADRNGDLAETVARELPNAWACTVDVTESKMVDSMVRQVANVLHRVDIVVNNAGIAGALAPTHQHPDDNWHRVINVNLNGAFYVLRAALAQMKGQKPSGGVVLNMSSTTALSGFGDIPAYTSAKAALLGLTRSTATEYCKDGIRVVALAPTVVKTALVDALCEATPSAAAGFDNFNPIPGMPTPEDVANACVFVCSDEARWISGSVLPIDGAYCAGKPKPVSSSS